ncbi:MAG TPA: kelch repeat-containing protein [Terriglobales bacterium]|nr:kelch repeat-containing protein [Terriglobales bacterium]
MKFLCSHTLASRIVPMMALVLTTTLSFASWSSTGSMRSARGSHAAVLLPSGYVLVAGGSNNNVPLASSELYSSASGAWSSTGNLNVARSSARAVLLANGKVLAMGGCINSDCLGSTTASAEIYNPSNGTWTTTGSMLRGRAEFVAVLLSSGNVLVAGGCTSYGVNGCLAVTTASELYNPSTGKWSPTGSLRAARMAMTATVLTNGKVLVAGGQTAASDALGSSELYNFATGAFSLTGRLITPRSGHTASLLQNGLVLMAGGENVNGISIQKAELYNSSTGTYSATGNMPSNRQEHAAVLLSTGSVLVAGGTNVTSNGTTVLATCVTYNPTTGTWTSASSMNSARVDHNLILLTNGHALAAGGDNGNNALSSAEIY